MEFSIIFFICSIEFFGIMVEKIFNKFIAKSKFLFEMSNAWLWLIPVDIKNSPKLIIWEDSIDSASDRICASFIAKKILNIKILRFIVFCADHVVKKALDNNILLI